MNSNVIMIHGSFGNPYENWIPWLQQQCNSSSIIFTGISFPTPEGQTFSNWSAILDGYIKSGVVNNNSIVVAHSSGASFFAKYATLNSCIVSKFISVSGFTNFEAGDPDFDKINSEFYLTEQKEMNLLNIPRKVAFFSKDDPYLPIEVLTEFAKQIEAETRIFDKGGHFNTASGFTSFKELFDEITKKI